MTLFEMRSFCIHICFWKSGAKALLLYFLKLRNLKSSIFYEIFGFAPPSSSSMIWWSRSHDLDFKRWNICIYIYIFTILWELCKSALQILMNWESKKVGYILGKIIPTSCTRIVTLGMLPRLPLSKVGCHLTKQNYLIMPCMLSSVLFFFFFFPSKTQLNSPHSISIDPFGVKIAFKFLFIFLN